MKGRKMQMHEGKTGDSDAMSEGKGLRRTFRGFLKRNSLRKLISVRGDRCQHEAYLLFAHGGDDGDEKIFTFIESGRNLRAKVTVGDLNIVLRGAILVHQIEESIVNVDLGFADLNHRRQRIKEGHTSWYSVRVTLGTSMLCVEGQISSCDSQLK
jgi:hypothetical protein